MSTVNNLQFARIYLKFGMTIEKRLLACRKAMKLTLDQVGAAITSDKKPEGLGKGTIQAWEKGRNEMTTSQIIALCKLYSVSPSYLLLGIDSELSQKECWLLDSYRSAGYIGQKVIDGAVTTSLNLAGAARVSDSSSAIVKK